MLYNVSSTLSGTLGDFLKWGALYSSLVCVIGARAEVFLGNGEAVITDRGPHHAVWSRLSQYVNSYGDVVTRSNGYVALATGMHYLKDGVWTASWCNRMVQASWFAVQGSPKRAAPSPAWGVTSVKALDPLISLGEMRVRKR